MTSNELSQNPEEFMTIDELSAHRAMGAGDSLWATHPNSRRGLLGKLTTRSAFIGPGGSGECSIPMSRAMLEKVQSVLVQETPEETAAINEWALKEDQILS